MKPLYLILHHSGSPLGTTFTSINNYHKRLWNFRSALGFYAGYQYIITSNGRLFQARKDTEEGAHTKTYNSKSVGICLTGNFQKDTMTDKQLETLTRLLDKLSSKYNIPPEKILGHRQLRPTLCPGNKLMVWLENYLKKEKEPEEDEKSLALDEIIEILKKYNLF